MGAPFGLCVTKSHHPTLQQTTSNFRRAASRPSAQAAVPPAACTSSRKSRLTFAEPATRPLEFERKNWPSWRKTRSASAHRVIGKSLPRWDCAIRRLANATKRLAAARACACAARSSGGSAAPRVSSPSLCSTIKPPAFCSSIPAAGRASVLSALVRTIELPQRAQALVCSCFPSDDRG